MTFLFFIIKKEREKKENKNPFKGGGGYAGLHAKFQAYNNNTMWWQRTR